MLLLDPTAMRKGKKKIGSTRYAKNIHLNVVDLGKNILFTLPAIDAYMSFPKLTIIGAGYDQR